MCETLSEIAETIIIKDTIDMLNRFSNDELRTICRQQIEMFEFWSRRLIHETCKETYGDNYLTYQYSDSNFLFSKSIRESVKKRFQGKPGRYTRSVDAFLFEDIVTILSNPKFFKKLFSEPLREAYPEGNEEVRTFLSRLIPIRNSLSHANPISIRNAEQVICYTNDFIDSLKNYYVRENIGMQYNVPIITKIIDSIGNEIYRDDLNETGIGVSWYLTKDSKNYLRPGDTYKVEVEVDPSFSSKDYTIRWKLNHIAEKKFDDNFIYYLKIKEEHVSISLPIECEITSNKKWHKHNYFDDCLTIHLRVLPPVN